MSKRKRTKDWDGYLYKSRFYSGNGSEWFWNRVNSIPRNQGGETAYVLGVALQNLEGQVMTYLENCEAKRVPKRRNP